MAAKLFKVKAICLLLAVAFSLFTLGQYVSFTTTEMIVRPLDTFEIAKEVFLSPPRYNGNLNITIMVRTSSVLRLLTQFYCMYLRSVQLFWPHNYGSMVLILDDESAKDHEFGETFNKQMQKYHPEIPVRVFYEPLPKNKSTLEFQGNGRGKEYNRQLWSTFLADTYTDEPIIAYMDTDTQITTPLTRQYLFPNGKLKVFGEGKRHKWTIPWYKSTLNALGVPLVVNFMITFPQLIYKDTLTNCKKLILRRFNTSDFEEAFSKIALDADVSPISIIMTYAWYYEYDRYDWHIKTTNLTATNEPLPAGHQVGPRDIMPSIVGAAHVSKAKTTIPELMIEGYCMSVKAAGRGVPGCLNVRHHLGRLCDYWETFFRYKWPAGDKWCLAGNLRDCCRKTMKKHYKDVAGIVIQNILPLSKRDFYLIDTWAKEMGISCPRVDLP